MHRQTFNCIHRIEQSKLYCGYASKFNIDWHPAKESLSYWKKQ